MRIVVYGLGIIGASMAAALKECGHTVLGRNRSREPLDYALAHGMIDGEAVSYDGADVVVLALPPHVTARELESGAFPRGCIVTDICGVKQDLENIVYSKPRSYRYVGMHPMAGKETSGIKSAEKTLFRGKNLVITRAAQTDESALEEIRSLAKAVGFGRIVECSAAEHDEKIALTSQLAHIVSNAYIRSPRTKDTVGFTGGSFQDMTRVGGVDENLWSELYLRNRVPLLWELDGLIGRLQEYRRAIAEEDEETLKEILREGGEMYRRFFCEK